MIIKPGDPELQKMIHQARGLPGEPVLAEPTFMRNEETGDTLVYPSVAVIVIGKNVLDAVSSAVAGAVLPGVFGGFNALFREQRIAFTREDILKAHFGWLNTGGSYDEWRASPGGEWAAHGGDESGVLRRLRDALRAIFPNAVFEDEEPSGEANPAQEG